jgi:hypothetical protein
MPPNQDIEFIIVFLSGTPPISKRPYRMSVNELVELKKLSCKPKDSSALAHPLGEPLCYLWRRKLELKGCV